MHDVDRSTPAAEPAARRPELAWGSFLLDKASDFALIFVGLSAAIAVERCQARARAQAEYAALLGDFRNELAVNLAQGEVIARDLGPLELGVDPPELGPLRASFDGFFAQLAADEQVVGCLHDRYAVAHGPGPSSPEWARCEQILERFAGDHGPGRARFELRPVDLAPFYRYEVWQLYLAHGVRTFQAKPLAVALGEVYNDARIVEGQVAAIERLYNDGFMRQVGKTAATDAELAELVADERLGHGLSPEQRAQLGRLSAAIKHERHQTRELMLIVELQVERMKGTVLELHAAIERAQAGLAAELARLGAR